MPFLIIEIRRNRTFVQDFVDHENNSAVIIQDYWDFRRYWIIFKSLAFRSFWRSIWKSMKALWIESSSPRIFLFSARNSWFSADNRVFYEGCFLIIIISSSKTLAIILALSLDNLSTFWFKLANLTDICSEVWHVLRKALKSAWKALFSWRTSCSNRSFRALSCSQSCHSFVTYIIFTNYKI